ncbi:MAG: hypothetical protein ACR2OX_12480 [Methyloligellaceae bacterium]
MMAASKQLTETQVDERPVLHLSGPVLGEALETLISRGEVIGGIEKLAEAIELKFAYFQDLLGPTGGSDLTKADFEELCAFMATVRRRVGTGMDKVGFETFRAAIGTLLDNAADATTADARLKTFIDAFPADKSFRWVRDLGAEILHGVLPEHYPLMSKWVWDARTNTGVLREVWHGDNVDHSVIEIADDYLTFLTLREELSQYLADNGVFRNMLAYVDLIKAQIYANYINSQGGVYLRTDFSSEGDPLEHIRRILGLDGETRNTQRMRTKTIDAEAQSVNGPKQLS